MSLWTVDDYGVVADRACWAMFAVTTVVVLMRVWSRLGYRELQLGLGLDDYITILCNIVLLITCVLVTIGSHYGLGRRMEDLDDEQIPRALKWNVIISSVLIWVFSLPKFAMVCTLKRILDYGLKTTIVFWFLALTSQASILATSIWWWKQCEPVEFGWDKSIEGTCAPIKVMSDLGYFTSAYSAFLDLFFALYPIPFVMRLNMRLKNRIAVSVALGLSSLAFIVSIYKLAIFGDIFEQLALNPTYPVPYLDILGVAEGCILIICASLPTLGPLFRATRTKLNSSMGQSNKSATGNSAPGEQNWSNLRGHKLENDMEGSSQMHSSIDDIPLVSPSNKEQNKAAIHKTTEISVSSG
ncbi:hypothetical protein LIA77_03218 [Sarocladium implicatum]|nr:hypothetical protein LIA77_03218 [Sarocladium implicatum]